MRAANQRPIVALGIILCLWAIAGCSASRRPVAPAVRAGGTPGTVLPEVAAAQPLADDLRPGSTAPDLDIEHPRVQDLVEAYQGRMRPTLERALERGSKYLPGMQSTLREEGVPPEFAYGVPIVESGYSLHATSHAGAVGPWQFIRGTGKRYGLRIDGYVDERRDPEKATRAAARYLRDLYDRFGDWHLALAAYNTGEGNIERIKYKRGCENFWEMRERGLLPSETSEYVPKVLAAMQVAREAQSYGIDVPASAEPRFDVIEVTRPISLKAVAQLTGSDIATIKELNPALRRGIVPPDGYTVRLPEGTRDQFAIALASYREPAPPRVTVAARHRGRTHRVRRGETLSRIARRYGVSVRALQRANGIKRARALRSGQRLHIPGRAAPVRVASASVRSKRSVAAQRPRKNVSAAKAPVKRGRVVQQPKRGATAKVVTKSSRRAAAKGAPAPKRAAAKPVRRR